MQIQVTGKHLDVGDALTEHVQTRLEGGINKYFDRTVDSHVVMSKQGPMFHVDCSVHLASGITLQAQGEADEIYAAFDGAADRLEKRVRRYKRRLKNHHRARENDVLQALDAPYYVLGNDSPEEEEVSEGLDPVIVAETTKPIKTMSVGEAVLQLNLTDSPVVVFHNVGHGDVNVVYRRPDGHIGWIDPSNVKN